MTRNMIRTFQGEEPANTRSGLWAAWADALFVSMLQCSDRPSTGQARQAIAAAIHAYGGRGCAERVAQEFGDHPETAVVRMRWALAVASECSDQRECLTVRVDDRESCGTSRPRIPALMPPEWCRELGPPMQVPCTCSGK